MELKSELGPTNSASLQQLAQLSRQRLSYYLAVSNLVDRYFSLGAKANVCSLEQNIFAIRTRSLGPGVAPCLHQVYLSFLFFLGLVFEHVIDLGSSNTYLQRQVPLRPSSRRSKDLGRDQAERSELVLRSSSDFQCHLDVFGLTVSDRMLVEDCCTEHYDDE